MMEKIFSYAVLKRAFAFLGRRPLIYGLWGLATGFLIFLFDMLLAASLQRFFTATGLVASGSHAPLGIALMSPTTEAIFLISIGLVRVCIFWANGHLNGLCQTTVETEKRHAVTEWAISSGKEEIGRVTTLYNDVVIGTAASVNNVFYVASRLIILAGLIGVMAWYSVTMTGLVFLLIGIMFPVQVIMDSIVSRNAKKIQASLASSISYLTSAIKNNLFIHLHDLVLFETRRIDDQIGIYKHSTERYFALSSLRAVVPQLLGLIAVCAIALQGSAHFPDNQGNLISYLYFILRLFQNLSDIARVSSNLRLNAPRVHILWKWWNDARAQPLRSAPSSAELTSAPVGWTARNLSYSYKDSSYAALRGVSFDIAPGSLVLITGPSGAGKSTLLYMLVGLMPPEEGSLQWFTAGHEAQPLTTRLPARMAYVGPEPFLVAGTIRDQLLLGQDCSLSDNDLISALHKARADFVLTLPGILNYRLTEQGGGLSAGQKQRLSLARALLRRPSVLMLDEATANLDPDTESAVFDAVDMLRGQMTILVVSHRPSSKLTPDQIISLPLSNIAGESEKP
jgi:ABC-type multidrug transport system fused ATPase/permease subunit